MKKCTKCNIEKELSEFCSKGRKGKFKLTASCTLCNRIIQKAERERRKEEIKIYKRQYQIDNKERLNAISNTYRENNLDKRKLYLSKYNERRRQLTKIRRETDPFYRATECFRNGVGRAFSQKDGGNRESQESY